MEEPTMEQMVQYLYAREKAKERDADYRKYADWKTGAVDPWGRAYETWGSITFDEWLAMGKSTYSDWPSTREFLVKNGFRATDSIPA